MAVAKPNKTKYKFQKITQETIDAILKDIQEGSPNKHAAESNGISESHFYNLISQGIVDIEYGLNDSLQAKMVVSLRIIEKKEIKECRKKIKNSRFSHKGAEWILQHSYWRYFSNNSPVRELADEIERLRNQYQNGAMKNDEIDHG